MLFYTSICWQCEVSYQSDQPSWIEIFLPTTWLVLCHLQWETWQHWLACEYWSLLHCLSSWLFTSVKYLMLYYDHRHIQNNQIIGLLNVLQDLPLQDLYVHKTTVFFYLILFSKKFRKPAISVKIISLSFFMPCFLWWLIQQEHRKQSFLRSCACETREHTKF